MESKSLEGVEKELRRRVERLVASHAQFWVSSAFRDPAKQQRLYSEWRRGLLIHGGSRTRAMKAGFVPANPPDVSKHCKQPAQAVDVGAPSGLEWLRALKAGEFGLKTPIRDEPWHMELNPDWASPIITTHKPAWINNDGDDDMPQPDDEIDRINWPDGSKTLLLRDGGIYTAGSPFFGTIFDIDDEFKKEWKGPRAITAINPSDPQAGYTVWSKGSIARYSFTPQVWEEIKKRKGY